jgi:Zn-dependent protease
MLRSWRIGTAFGIGIYIHPTFWLLPLMVVLRSYSANGLDMVGMWLVLLAAAMGCVVLHELGHAQMARYFGIRTRDITLYPIGGVARLERLSEKPVEELLIALAGPAVNVVIAALLIPPVVVLSMHAGFATLWDSGLGFFLVNLLFANLLLVGFNLLPAFPMDGGRVLRAVLAMPLGRLRATEVAAKVGLVMAVLMAVAYLFSAQIPLVGGFFSNPMLMLVAVFIVLVGQQELMMVRHQEAARRAREAEAATLTAAPILYDVTGAPIRPGFSGLLWDSRLRAWVQWRDGQPVATFGAGPE